MLQQQGQESTRVGAAGEPSRKPGGGDGGLEAELDVLCAQRSDPSFVLADSV